MFLPPDPNEQRKMKIKTSVQTPETNPVKRFFKEITSKIKIAITNPFKTNR